MAYLCIELRYDHSNVLCMRKNKSILLDKNIMKYQDESAFWNKPQNYKDAEMEI